MNNLNSLPFGSLQLQHIQSLIMDMCKCPVCHSQPQEPINLRCDHHPCFTCASSIMTLDQQTDIETKYKIICPICNVKTVTYDIRHLIINNTQQDEDLYVTTKYLSKKVEVQPKKQKINNFVKDSSDYNSNSSQTHSKRNSTHGIINVCSSNRPINFECKNHAGFNLQYYCEQCSKNASSSNDIFFCSECAKSHTQKNHKLTSIRQSASQIEQKNHFKKEMGLPSKKKQLQIVLKGMHERQDVISSQFQKLYKDLNEEFKQIYQIINDQYQAMKKEVKSIYSKQCEELKSNIQFVQRLKDSLSGLQKMYALDNSDIQSQVSFYIYSSQIEKAIEVNKAKIGRVQQTPTIVKKVCALIVNSSDKLMQLSYGSQNHRKTMSKMVSPTNSARSQFQNCGNQSGKKGKGHFNIELYTSLKQNMQIYSPKASMDYRH